VPVWLETNSTHARSIYEYFGFKIVEETRLGVGVVDADGWAKEDGEGLGLWGLILDG
jgi:hypothetical protein